MATRPDGGLSREIDLSPLRNALRTTWEHPAETLLAGALLRVWAYLSTARTGWTRGRCWRTSRTWGSSTFLAAYGRSARPDGVPDPRAAHGRPARRIRLCHSVPSPLLRTRLALALRETGGLPAVPQAALVALALFALSDDLVYYSSELKPYSSDAGDPGASSTAARTWAGALKTRGRGRCSACLRSRPPGSRSRRPSWSLDAAPSLAIDRASRGWWRDVGRLAVVGVLGG